MHAEDVLEPCRHRHEGQACTVECNVPLRKEVFCPSSGFHGDSRNDFPVAGRLMRWYPCRRYSADKRWPPIASPKRAALQHWPESCSFKIADDVFPVFP